MTDTIFQIAILIMSVVVHEASHGFMARRLGDRTAEYAGRLTLNPIRHIDLWGSVIVPLILAISKAGFIIGWAKPVPVNPYNLRNQRWGEAMVAVAGPASNVFLAVVFGLLLRFGFIPSSAVLAVGAIVAINLILAVFNLVPIPPLDGSKILFALLPPRFFHIRETLERYGLIFAVIFILFLWQFVSPLVGWLFQLIIG